MKANYTHIALLLDTSLSVIDQKENFRVWLNDLIKSLQNIHIPGTTSVELDCYDNEKLTELISIGDVSGKLIADIPNTLLPIAKAGDLLSKFIDKTSTAIVALEEDQRPDKVLYIVVSLTAVDVSVLPMDTLRKKIQLMEATKQGNFVYVGANQNYEWVASYKGIKKSAGFTLTSNGIKAVFALLTETIQNYRGTGVVVI
jgi:hypothetical protein